MASDAERARFIEVRKALGISQRQLGEELGMTQAGIAAWETGRWGGPTRRDRYALVGICYAAGRTDLARSLLEVTPAVIFRESQREIRPLWGT